VSPIINKLRTPGEEFYRVMMIIFGVLMWGSIVGLVMNMWPDPKLRPLLVTFLSYGAAFAIFVFVSGAAYRAFAFGNMLMLGPNQFPQLHAMVVEGSRELGLSSPPVAFLYNSNGLFNAFARRLMGGRYVFLTSALVEASDDAQVRFIIGHEIGHHAAGHLNPWMNTIKLPAHFVPFLGRAYSRSREFTCDNVGAFIAKDANASCSSLQMLGCGCRRLNPSMNLDAFLAQEKMVPPVFGFLNEIFRTHPRLTRRVKAIAANHERIVNLANHPR